MLTAKTGAKVLVRADVIKNARTGRDGAHSVCVLDIVSNEERDTIVVVKESVEDIYRTLEELDADAKPPAA